MMFFQLYNMKSKSTLLILSLLVITTISYGQKNELPTFITDSLDNYKTVAIATTISFDLNFS